MGEIILGDQKATLPHAGGRKVAGPRLREAWQGGRTPGKRVRRKGGRKWDEARATHKPPATSVATGHWTGYIVQGHWNAKALANKQTLLKELMSRHGVCHCGVSETHLYRARGLSDKKWGWEAGPEHCPQLEHRLPPKGVGAFTDTRVRSSLVRTGKFSMWMRLENPTGKPIFIAECYMPHGSKLKEHREAWDEMQQEVRDFCSVGHIVMCGDFHFSLQDER